MECFTFFFMVVCIFLKLKILKEQNFLKPSKFTLLHEQHLFEIQAALPLPNLNWECFLLEPIKTGEQFPFKSAPQG